MNETTIVELIIGLFGVITFVPHHYAQLFMLFAPAEQSTMDIIIGKGEKWRDETHYKSALAFAWADCFVILPTLIVSYIGVFKGSQWGYALWLALGILSIYFSIVFWVMEKKYVYPTAGRFAYYTYFWGFFGYWGVAAVAFSLFQIL